MNGSNAVWALDVWQIEELVQLVARNEPNDLNSVYDNRSNWDPGPDGCFQFSVLCDFMKNYFKGIENTLYCHRQQ